MQASQIPFRSVAEMSDASSSVDFPWYGSRFTIADVAPTFTSRRLAVNQLVHEDKLVRSKQDVREALPRDCFRILNL